MQLAQRGGNAKRQLRARAKPCMGGHGLLHRQVKHAVEMQRARHNPQIALRPPHIRPADAPLRRLAQAQAGAQLVDAEAKAAKAPPQPAIHVQKAEMQARRQSHGYAGYHLFV